MSVLPIDSLETPRFCGVPTFMRLPQATSLEGIDAAIIGIFAHVWFLAIAVYAAVMWKLKGSTVGDIVFGLRVVRLDDQPLSWEAAIIRALGCFLSAAALGLGFFWIAFDPDKQAWHDKFAGTVVVRTKGVSLV